MSILKFGLFDIIKEGNLLCKPGMKYRLSNIKPRRHSAAHKILLRPFKGGLHLAPCTLRPNSGSGANLVVQQQQQRSPIANFPSWHCIAWHPSSFQLR